MRIILEKKLSDNIYSSRGKSFLQDLTDLTRLGNISTMKIYFYKIQKNKIALFAKNYFSKARK